ncbi:unnamed protein product [Mytilus edulis]|uniref:QRICH1-like domain-containing protein n=1 Tax=Mytilus edulis TaxID=6550 RepID=A0A8S3S414_MYTED|nr:unnamed protein product [Mytilus edulis]
MAGAAEVATEKRFPSLNNEEIKKILIEKDSKNTRRSTDSSVRTFKSYLREKNLPEDFENLPNNELDSILFRFYPEARTENGELYKKSSLFSLRHGINRHLSNFDSGKDIVHDTDFKDSNKVFLATTKDLKRQGKGGINHYPPIELSDLNKLYEYFDVNNNVQLQEKVFVDLMLYFGRRGRENIHELKITDFAATTDADGRVYIYMSSDELTKNHQQDENTADGRMYASDDDLCPVRSFRLYTSHLRGNKCDRLFQRPSTKMNSVKWYDSIPMGHNTIGNLMPTISGKAGLSVRYTNHSLRATSVHVLDNIGKFASRHIMTVTGHKSEASLKTYTGYTGDEIKKNMSDTISDTLRKPPTKKLCVREDFGDFELKPLSNSQFQDLLNDLDIDIAPKVDEKNNISTTDHYNKENINSSCVQNLQSVNIDNESICNRTVNYMDQRFPMPVLNNCSNVTINFNLK